MSSAAQVGPDTVVTLAYTLYDEDGDVLDRTEGEAPVSYLHGYGQIVPGLERGVEGMSKGDVRSVVVSAADGYGEYDPAAVVEIDRHDFPRPEDVVAGDEFVAESDEGESVSMTVLEVHGEPDANRATYAMHLRLSADDTATLKVPGSTDLAVRVANLLP